MEHILEFYHDEECIEQRKSDVPPWPLPAPGDIIHISFGNPSYHEEHGNVWRVTGRRLLLFAPDSGVRTAQLAIEPVREDGPTFSTRVESPWG